METSDRSAAHGALAPARRLKANALRIGDVVVMALASSGPTQSIALDSAEPPSEGFGL